MVVIVVIVVVVVVVSSGGGGSNNSFCIVTSYELIGRRILRIQFRYIYEKMKKLTNNLIQILFQNLTKTFISKEFPRRNQGFNMMPSQMSLS